MTKMIEFELLQGRNDLLAVVPLLENAEGQDEDRVFGVDR